MGDERCCRSWNHQGSIYNNFFKVQRKIGCLSRIRVLYYTLKYIYRFLLKMTTCIRQKASK